MKNALILHGTNGNSKENWFPWLEQELIKKGYEVWTPDLPHAEKPNLETYGAFIFKNFTFTRSSVIIGHSSGAVAILGILQALPEDIVVDAAILVAGFTDNLSWDALDELFLRPFDWEKIKKHARKIVLIHSDNDPYVALRHGEKLKSHLGAELVIMPGQFHFSVSSAGPTYKTFPQLLTYL